MSSEHGISIPQLQDGQTRGLRNVVVSIANEADTRTLIAYAFEREGVQVISRAEGFDGLSAVRQYRPKLVVLDLRIRGLCSAEIGRAIRTDPTLTGLLILGLLGPQQEPPAFVPEGACVDFYVQGPVELESFTHVAITLLGRCNAPSDVVRSFRASDSRNC